ncbi:MAG: hypothetical protein KDK54_20535 [Leptospiraceae bacterium]|nr:hypothetical protein [Leptospiraceae bacterium]
MKYSILLIRLFLISTGFLFLLFYNYDIKESRIYLNVDDPFKLISIAKKYIDKNDYRTAIQALEKAIHTC